jgi:hypothetical protein
MKGIKKPTLLVNVFLFKMALLLRNGAKDGREEVLAARRASVSSSLVSSAIHVIVGGSSMLA